MNETLDYEQVTEYLIRAGAEITLAEAHGMLCGMLCARNEVDTPAWAREIFGRGPEQADLLMREALTQLAWLLKQTREQLNDAQLGFDPMLPDDERPLEERARALSDWCQGFLAGFGMASGGRDKQLPDNVSELLRDFGEITKATADEDAAEGDEDSYAQVVEYVRVGVLLIYEELHPIEHGPVQE